MWLGEIAARHAAVRPDALALRDRNRDLSWRELDREVRALAAALRARTARGSAVVVLSAGRVEVLASYLACSRADLLIAPLNPALTQPELRALLGTVRPALALADAAGLAQLRQLDPALPVIPMDDIATLPAPDHVSILHSGLDTPRFLLHTSATTGTAKAAVLGEEAHRAHTLSWLAQPGADPDKVLLTGSPLFHGAMTIPLTYLAAGATVCLPDRFTPQGCLAALERWRVTDLFLVPAMLQLLLRTKALASTDLSALRVIMHGAAPMPEDLREQVERLLKVDLCGIYSCTEAGGCIVTLAPHDQPGAPPVPGATCAGRPGLGTRMRLTDRNAEPTPAGEVGEIRLSGPGLMHGYRGNPEATAAVLHDGWFATRDLGVLDESGRLWVVNRREDLLLRGGQNVYPAEVEQVLRQLPQVLDAAVVPAPSPEWGQVPVAFLVTTEHVPPSTLIRHCVTRLADHKRPVRYVPLDELPRNPAGKILRNPLRLQAERLLAESAEP